MRGWLGAVPGRAGRRAVARDYRRRLAAHGLGLDAGIEEVRAALERVRGKPITLIPLPLSREGGTITGAWWPAPSEHMIFYEAETGRLHQLQIIAHELFHMVCGHEPKPLEDEEMVAVRRAMRAALQRHLGADVDIGTLNPPLTRVTVRAGPDRSREADEEEAEGMASLMVAGSAPVLPALSTVDDPSAGAVLERLERALNAGVGH